MYCKKCGKFIEGEAEICQECLAKEQAVAEQPAEQNVQTIPVQQGSRKTGLKKGIIGAVFAYVALMIMGTASMWLLEEMAYVSSIGSLDEEVVVMSIMLCVAAIGFSIPGLIVSIKAFNIARLEQREGRVVPVATKILGIVGLAMAAFTLAMSALLVFLLLLLLSVL